VSVNEKTDRKFLLRTDFLPEITRGEVDRHGMAEM